MKTSPSKKRRRGRMKPLVEREPMPFKGFTTAAPISSEAASELQDRAVGEARRKSGERAGSSEVECRAVREAAPKNSGATAEPQPPGAKLKTRHQRLGAEGLKRSHI